MQICLKYFLDRTNENLFMRNLIFQLVFSSVIFFPANGQNPVLEEYIADGLEANLALKQRQLDYAMSVAALREARGLFFPEISLNARYTVADGGRVIEFPVGDLLNPVYNTLNLLTASQQFPEIENQEFNFYRAKEHETKLSLTQPLFSTDVFYNARIRQTYTKLSAIDINQYKRELILEIQKTYYNYLQAEALNDLADSTMLLVKENLRVNRSLYSNDLRTMDAVYRAEAEVSKVEAEKARVVQMLAAGKAYFNFLLNRPLDSDITIYHEIPQPLLISLVAGQEQAVSNREELSMMKQYRSLNDHQLALQKSTALPGLFAAVDYGFQGEEYTFTAEDDFLLASLVLRWDLFGGLTNRNRIAKTRIEGEKLATMHLETEKKIRMQVVKHYYAVLAAYDAITAAKNQLRSARSAFRLINRKYREDQSSLLEFIDARTSYTAAETNLIMATNNYFISMAALEHAIAGADLNLYKE
jgi:outer membrane protein